MKKLRAAICISGQLRTYKQCFDNLKRNIIDKFDSDVFIQTWDEVGASHKESHDKKEMVNGEILMKMYNPKKLIIEKQPENASDVLFGKKVPNSLKEIQPIHYRSALSMFYQIYSCNDLAIQYAKDNHINYDIVIRVRPDSMFLEPIPSYLLKQVISSKNIVFFADYAIRRRYQVCDKFAFGDIEGMKKYSNVWNEIEEHWKDPIGNNPPHTHKVGERLLKYHVTKCSDLRCVPMYMRMYNLRVDGTKVNYNGLNIQKKMYLSMMNRLRLF